MYPLHACCIGGPPLRDPPAGKSVVLATLVFYGAGVLAVLAVLAAQFL